MDKRGRSIYAFIDAANLFYGGERSMHFRIDYEKLIAYLRAKFAVTKVFYYAGVDVETYKEEGKKLNLGKLVKFYENEMLSVKGEVSAGIKRTEEEKVLLEAHLNRAMFYRDLEKFGYDLRIKPTKVFVSTEGITTTKANCDVDLTFDMMRYMSQYNEAIVMSGDGDFAPIVEYLKAKKKKITILARAERTAREIKELAGVNFVDFKSIRKEIESKTEKVSIVSRKIGGDLTRRTISSKKIRRNNVVVMNNGVTIKRKIPKFRKGF